MVVFITHYITVIENCDSILRSLIQDKFTRSVVFLMTIGSVSYRLVKHNLKTAHRVVQYQTFFYNSQTINVLLVEVGIITCPRPFTYFSVVTICFLSFRLKTNENPR